jgi:hypothetical protein
MVAKFQMYDVVRVVRLPTIADCSVESRFRAAQIGDTGTVVMAYEQPREGYTVEAVAPDGKTEWLLDFLPDDLEIVWREHDHVA